MRRAKQYRILLSTLAMLWSMAGVVFCQEQADSTEQPVLFYVGIVGSFGPTAEFGRFGVLGFDECGTFQSGSGSTWNGAALVEFPTLLPFPLQLRLGGRRAAGELREPLEGERPVSPNGGQVVQAHIDQILAYERTELTLAPLLRLHLADQLHLEVGGEFAYTIARSERLSQQAISPDDLLLGNYQRNQTLAEGELVEGTPIAVSAEIGAAYDLPISRLSTISPEVGIRVPLTDRSGDGSWRELSLNVGLGLRFAIPGSQPDTLPIPPPDTPVVVRTPLLVPSVLTDPSVVTVTIDEYDSLEVLPVLNRIFFAQHADSIPERYVQLSPEAAGIFTNDSLTGSALEVYRQILNIIGRRMSNIPTATITLNGYRNGTEQDSRLGLRRAGAVKAYLVDIWGIDPGRIKTTGGALPPGPARESGPEGLRENARVEIVPSDLNIILPIQRLHKQRVASPPLVTFFPKVEAEAGLASWELEVGGEGEVWKNFSGTVLPDSIVWNWRSNEGSLPTLPLKLAYRLIAVDSTSQQVATDPTEIDVTYETSKYRLEHREEDSTIANYSLLLFNYDSPEVSEIDYSLIQAIAANVQSGSLVRFTGYTDSLGEAEYNRKLGAARAAEAAALFQRHASEDITVVVDRENGGEKERFPYDTPEGRAYCRAVVIEVKTPVMKDGS